MCARKYMFGDKSTFGSCKDGQHTKIGKTRKNMFLYTQQGPITHL